MTTIAYVDNGQQQAEYLLSLADQAGVPRSSLVRKRDGWSVPQAVATLYNETLVDSFPGDGHVRVVYADTNLSAKRPEVACVYWKFSAGVDVGTDGANIVNGHKGDLVFVASA